MARKITPLYQENQSLFAAAKYYNDASDALILYFSSKSPTFSIRFFDYNPSQVQEELGRRLDELDMNSSLTVLSTIEAAFRIDYIQRCYLRKRDNISRDFREIYKVKTDKIKLRTILEIWRQNTPGKGRMFTDLNNVFKYRHWLAHGRYWKPNARYDYLTLYQLASQVFGALPFVSA